MINPHHSAVYEMLKPLIDELVAADGRNLNQLAIAYGIAKDGEKPQRQDKYRNTLLRIVENPDSSSWENLSRFLRVLGVDAETAIAIAASQIKSHKTVTEDS